MDLPVARAKLSGDTRGGRHVRPAKLSTRFPFSISQRRRREAERICQDGLALQAGLSCGTGVCALLPAGFDGHHRSISMPGLKERRRDDDARRRR